jgi:hypothetical protein
VRLRRLEQAVKGWQRIGALFPDPAPHEPGQAAISAAEVTGGVPPNGKTTAESKIPELIQLELIQLGTTA